MIKCYTWPYFHSRCNIPKEMMGFPDFPFPDNVPGYVHHSVFLKYLEDYTEHFGLWPYIRHNTEVIKIIPIPVLTSSIVDTTVWEVTTRNVRTGVTDTMEYDAVFVCNGLVCLKLKHLYCLFIISVATTLCLMSMSKDWPILKGQYYIVRYIVTLPPFILIRS